MIPVRGLVSRLGALGGREDSLVDKETDLLEREENKKSHSCYIKKQMHSLKLIKHLNNLMQADLYYCSLHL